MKRRVGGRSLSWKRARSFEDEELSGYEVVKHRSASKTTQPIFQIKRV